MGCSVATATPHTVLYLHCAGCTAVAYTATPLYCSMCVIAPQALDFIIYAAGQYNLRLVMALGNFWNAFKVIRSHRAPALPCVH